MPLDIVVNELSLHQPAPNIQTAQLWMREFIETIRAARAHGAKTLRTERDFQTYELTPGYPIARWRNDSDVDRETKLFFKTVATASPYLVDQAELEQTALGYEFTYEGIVAHGLGVAHLMDAPAISFKSEECWDSPGITIRSQTLTPDGEIIAEDVDVIHASCRDHVAHHTTWFSQRRQRNVVDGADMWRRRSELFPSLLFCDSIMEQLEALHTNHPQLPSVMRHLFALESYATNWHSEPFNDEAVGLNMSVDTQVTLGQYAAERTFMCPDGQQRLFSWHSKINLGAWRIYFLPEATTIIVGYIGGHLRTHLHHT